MRTKLVSMRIAGSVAVLALAMAGVAAAQQAMPPGTLAEQGYKNIQVLKGLPADQVTPIMRMIARDLGVTCEFCHEEADRSADSLETKETARSMIRMMNDINKNSFGGNTAVTCVTCHNGHSEPSNLPTLPPYAVAMLGPGDEVKPPTLPTADQILTKYVQALGGEAALRRVTSMTITGKRQNLAPGAAAVPAPFAIEQYWKAPNLSTTIARPANGATSSGFDGTGAWAQDARGRVTPLAGAAANRAKRDASDFYSALNMKTQYQRLTVTGIEKIGDKNAYVVIAAPQNERAEWFYFDTQTGLLLRHQTITPTPVGDSPLAVDYEDYRDAGMGVKVPYTVNIVGPSRPDCVRITVEKVELNAAIDNGKFARPAPRAQ